MSKKNSITSCPCGSGNSFDSCCGPAINGKSVADSAEALMRSRYTAYVQGNEQYLLTTWHPSTRPETLNLTDNPQWIRLKILACDEEHVEFVATCRINGKAHRMHEKSRFIFEDSRWYYADGEVEEHA